MYTVFLGDSATSASNDSIVSLAISGASVLVNVSGASSIVSSFVENTFIALRLCILPGSRTRFRISPKFEDLK